MSKHETPMTRRYWERVGGTLLEEYRIVPRGPGVGQRLIDAVIIVDGEHRIAPRAQHVISLERRVRARVCRCRTMASRPLTMRRSEDAFRPVTAD